MSLLKRQYRRVAAAALMVLGMLAWHAESIAGQITASWSNNTADAVGLSVERSVGGPGAFSEITTTGPTATTFTDSAVTDGTTYCYRVRAYNPTTYSDYSNTACSATAQAFGLAVVRAGTGSGVVISAPSGILCGTTCSGTYAGGTPVTLTPTPATGSTFAGWSGGGCTGTGTCTVTVTSTTSVTATFNGQPMGLSVTKAGTGSGTVSGAPAGITCGITCSASYPYGTAVTLTAVAATGSTFTGWSGACTGTGSCGVTLTSAAAVTATFTQQQTQTPSPTLTVAVSGKGTVTSTAAEINCGKTCSATYPSGTLVTLAAAPGNGFSFVGWGGACTGTSTCVVSMTNAQNVTATFRNTPGKR